jgi:hypothetical protein
MERTDLHEGKLYRNLKTKNVYHLLRLACSSEDQTELVVYESAEGRVWVRPLALFCQKFERATDSEECFYCEKEIGERVARRKICQDCVDGLLA